jgi:hypothetical protein
MVTVSKPVGGFARTREGQTAERIPREVMGLSFGSTTQRFHASEKNCVLLRPVTEVSPVRSASLTTRQRVGCGACGSCALGGQPPSRRSGPARPETPGCLTGAPRARSGGKPQEGRGSGDGSPDRDAQEGPVAQAKPRLSRGAAELECEREGWRRRWPWRSGENPGEAESQESIGPTAGRQPRGVRTRRAEKHPEAAENRDLPENLRVEDSGF